MFVTIILISFYYPIKVDLDKKTKFPYSIIYGIITFMAISLITIQNKNEIKYDEEHKNNSNLNSK